MNIHEKGNKKSILLITIYLPAKQNALSHSADCLDFASELEHCTCCLMPPINQSLGSPNAGHRNGAAVFLVVLGNICVSVCAQEALLVRGAWRPEQHSRPVWGELTLSKAKSQASLHPDSLHVGLVDREDVSLIAPMPDSNLDQG